MYTPSSICSGNSGGANGHNGGGPNCQASEPVALLKDPPGKRYLVFNGINYLHPGRLTWNLQITHLERKNDLPNLYDYVPC